MVYGLTESSATDAQHARRARLLAACSGDHAQVDAVERLLAAGLALDQVGLR
jgi:hypothetical protein